MRDHVFGHEPVVPDADSLGEFYQCETCGYVGETLVEFDAQDCVQA